MACVTGVVELLMLLIHLAMLGAVIVFFLTEVAAHPEITEDEFDGLLALWFTRVSLVSSTCHFIWVAATVMFFMSIRSRSTAASSDCSDTSIRSTY